MDEKDIKDLELQIKKNDRYIVELLVAKELMKLAKESAINAVSCYGDMDKYKVPDGRAWARKIIAIVQEHSV